MKYLSTILFLLFSFTTHSADQIYITKGNVQAVPIAVNSFAHNDSKIETKFATEIIEIIKNDLAHSGLFRPVNQEAFIENISGYNIQPNFSSWKTININFLVNGSIEKKGMNKFIIRVVLWDIYNQKNILSIEYESQYASLRRVAHKISDQIFEIITGEKGYFDTQILYIAESGSDKKKTKRIAMMDYDGKNHKYITNGKYTVLNPRLSRNQDRILYTSYENKKPKVVLHDLKNGKKTILGNFPGTSVAARFSPNNNHALMSVTHAGNSDIYEVNLDLKTIKRLTNNHAINVSASYSPDGKSIVFNSDKSGSAQLYIMDVDGTNIRRISFGNGTYTAPVWSPRGDYIAFIKNNRELGFTIGIMRPDGSDERILTNGYLVDSPTWSPSGRYILFSREFRQDRRGYTKSKIYSIDITGRNEKEVNIPDHGSDPEWSSIVE